MLNVAVLHVRVMQKNALAPAISLPAIVQFSRTLTRHSSHVQQVDPEDRPIVDAGELPAPPEIMESDPKAVRTLWRTSPLTRFCTS